MTTSATGEEGEPQLREVRIVPNIRIPLENGFRLGAVAYLPERGDEPAPAILVQTPYVAQSHHGAAKYFASHGYPVLVVDVRGRGESEGVFHPLNDAGDGCEAAEWLVGQEWCDGRIAMWGGSYLGHCQWNVAAKAPAGLSTITPTAAPRYGVDVPMRNNVFPAYQAQWLSLISGRTLRGAIFGDDRWWRSVFLRHLEQGSAFRALADRIGEGAGLFCEWLDHPCQGTYWDQYSPSDAGYAAISMPVLTITGAYDGDQPGALDHYRRHLAQHDGAADPPHYLVIGPWDHAGTSVPKTEFCGMTVGEASRIDLRHLHLDWYDWVLRGRPRPTFLADTVACYVIGADIWRYAPTLDALTLARSKLYLGGDTNPVDVFHSGQLSQVQRAGDTPHQFRWDPTDTVLAALERDLDPEDQTDQTLLLARTGHQLVYHAAALEEPLEICGFFSLSVWLAIDTPDADFHAGIHAVMPDGTAICLTTDWVRARHRMGLHESRPVTTTEPQDYVFDRFTFVARTLPTGSRLRLVIAPLESIHQQRNFNGGGAVADQTAQGARPVTVRLFHDADHPGALTIPLGAS